MAASPCHSATHYLKHLGPLPKIHTVGIENLGASMPHLWTWGRIAPLRPALGSARYPPHSHTDTDLQRPRESWFPTAQKAQGAVRSVTASTSPSKQRTLISPTCQWARQTAGQSLFLSPSARRASGQTMETLTERSQAKLCFILSSERTYQLATTTKSEPQSNPVS